MTEAILVLNAGSSSLKFSLYECGGNALTLRLHGEHERLTTGPHFIAHDAENRIVAEASSTATSLDYRGVVEHLLGFVQETLHASSLIGVGHRVVHGGTQFAAPVRIDGEVLSQLAALAPLAPLHQTHNLAPIRVIAEHSPELPQVACFDTAFHRTQPAIAQAFALPPRITERGVRRYGFHGLSYEYIAQALQQIDADLSHGRVIVAHLGNGVSMCAMRDGRSVASTMGFTTLDGLMMGTRCGALDPGVVLYLQDELAMDVRSIEHLFYYESGLLGVSGISSDMRTLLASDESRAKLAIELFCYRIGRELGSLASALHGLDGLVFTGGIGEHAAPIRAKVLSDADWLGFELDAAANAASATRISSASSAVAAYVIPTNEELMIARHTRALIGP